MILHRAITKRAQLIKLVCAVCIVCLALLYIADSVPYFYAAPPAPADWRRIRQQQDAARNPAYFVHDTTAGGGCRMPSFPVFSETVRRFYARLTPPASHDGCTATLTQSDATGHVWVAHNRSALLAEFGIATPETVHCAVVPLERLTDNTNELRVSEQLALDFGQVVRVHRANFVRVRCDFETTMTAKRLRLDEYHFFVQPVTVAEATAQPTNSSAAPAQPPDQLRPDQLNVMVVGIDAVSRLNFHRQMPRTAAVLLDRLGAVELLGYNKVGDNTYPNLMPVLTGLDVDELSATCLGNANSTYDACSFIWDLYREQGYTTAFAEDMAGLGLFNYFRKGFRRQPTDFRLRPLIMEMEMTVSSKHVANAHLCLGGRRPIDILVEYIQRFLEAMTRTTAAVRPFFAFFWTASYTHDFFNYPQLIDDRFAEFLGSFDDSNTFLLLMSDHGMRWGPYRRTYQGMMEERQPFLFLVPPRWFASRHPVAFGNLLANRHRLTTHFDLYETLRDLLEPAASLSAATLERRTAELRQMEPLPRGLSLFVPVPATRTCAQAGISPHWCTCHEKRQMATSGPMVRRAARYVVQHINELVRPYESCQTLSLHSIADATAGASNDDIVGGRSAANRTEHFADVTVRLRTKPGLAEFEATVRVLEGAEGALSLTGPISRTNLYGTQSECVYDARIKLYCFCDSFM